MDRSLFRLNVLLETTAAWGRSASLDGLAAELHRIKWVLDFDRCSLLVGATAHVDARLFVVGSPAARAVPMEALGDRDAASIRRALGQEPASPDPDDDRTLAYPLESGARVLGALCVSSDRAPYALADRRYAQFVAQTLAGIVDRLLAREDERQSSANEERQRSLLSVLTDVPWSTNADGEFDVPQPAWSAFTGQTWEQLRGFGWAQAIHPEDRDAVREAWADACSRRALYESRGRLWHAASGEYRHFVARAIPLRDPDGTVREWVGTCTDVHEQRRAEDALRESERRLKEADRRKDEFLATLAHELRNPLAPIRAGLQLIRIAGDTPGAVERVGAVMERQVGHMVRLIDDLLDVSRITSGRIVLQRRTTPLADLVAGAVEANRTRADAAQVRLAVESPEQGCWLDVDPTRFVQILSNLLDNAIKFTPPGGLVRVAATIRENPDGAPPMLELTVADEGAGISAEVLPQIFDLFVQGPPRAARTDQGLGIGLALTRRLVELHGGIIEARSAGEGLGSEFLIRLPVAAMPQEAAVPAAPPEIRRIPRRVLIVDDNRDAADTLALLVTELGCEVRTALDGESALRSFAEFHPHVVLLDIGLPGIDGYETCRRIRRLDAPTPVVMVALTGWGQEQDRRRAMQAGFDAHLTKPADEAALSRLLFDSVQ